MAVPIFPASAAEEPAILSKPSRYPVAETLDRLENVLKAKGLVIFARVDHGGEARKVGLQLRPTQLLIFGNPKTGTALMDAAPLLALDLPLKALAWQDNDGKVWAFLRPARRASAAPRADGGHGEGAHRRRSPDSARARMNVPGRRPGRGQMFRDVEPGHADPVVGHAVVNVEALRLPEVVPPVNAGGKHHVGDGSWRSCGSSGVSTGAGDR